MPRVARIRVPIYQETGKHTLYRIEVTTDDGRTRKVERRYRDVLRFHGTLCRAAPHPKLEQFDFPHKSILNTNAEFTKERRRSGFEAYFALLLSLGPNYAPFVETFLKADERSFDDSGHSRPPTPPPVAPAVVFEAAEDKSDIRPLDERLFWWGLYVPAAAWAFLLVTAVISLKLQWLIVVGAALALSGANVVGYTKCSKEAQARLEGLTDAEVQAGLKDPFQSSARGGKMKRYSFFDSIIQAPPYLRV